jgi:hypothetical protein
MQQKKESTRNVILVVAGLLFFCMMGKEGFNSVTWDATYDGVSTTRAESDSALSGSGNPTSTVSGIIAGSRSSSSFKFANGWTKGTSLVGEGESVLNATCNLTGTGAGIATWPNEVQVKSTGANGFNGDLTGATIDNIYECVDTSATPATTCPAEQGAVSCSANTVYKPGKALPVGGGVDATNCCGPPDQSCSEGLAALTAANSALTQRSSCPELGSVLQARVEDVCSGQCTENSFNFGGECCDKTATPPAVVCPSGTCADSEGATVEAASKTVCEGTAGNVWTEGKYCKSDWMTGWYPTWAGGDNCHDASIIDKCQTTTEIGDYTFE